MLVDVCPRTYLMTAETVERAITLRTISAELAARGHLSSTGKPYVTESVKRMLEK